jgi:hypothetical protein
LCYQQYQGSGYFGLRTRAAYFHHLATNCSALNPSQHQGQATHSKFEKYDTLEIACRHPFEEHPVILDADCRDVITVMSS